MLAFVIKFILFAKKKNHNLLLKMTETSQHYYRLIYSIIKNNCYKILHREKIYFSFDNFLNIEREIESKLYFQQITLPKEIYNPKWCYYKDIRKMNDFIEISHYRNYALSPNITIILDLKDLSIPPEKFKRELNIKCSPKIISYWPLLLNLYCFKKKNINIYY
jgi:hypothetical protein